MFQKEETEKLLSLNFEKFIVNHSWSKFVDVGVTEKKKQKHLGFKGGGEGRASNLPFPFWKE